MFLWVLILCIQKSCSDQVDDDDDGGDPICTIECIEGTSDAFSASREFQIKVQFPVVDA